MVRFLLFVAVMLAKAKCDFVWSFKRSTADEESLTLKQFSFLVSLVMQFPSSRNVLAGKKKFSHKFSTTTYPNVCKSREDFLYAKRRRGKGRKRVA